MNDFDGKTAPGSMFGVRAFDTDEKGRLIGVSVPAVFRPGENIATCQRPDQRWREPVSEGHRAGTGGCSCGFWAFTDGTHDYGGCDNWSAIIEGYGLVTRGTRGFRAEKARLVALVPPASGTPCDARTAFLYGREGVPVYPTLRDALTHHQISGYRPQDEPGEGFWDKTPEPETEFPVASMVTFGIYGHTYTAGAAPSKTCTCSLCRAGS